MQHITGISEILGDFQAVLLDQFGVLHDGKVPYPRAIEAVRALAEAGKHVVVLSNSSRRSGGTIGKLERMGFDAGWFAGAVTSGELAHSHLESRPGEWWRRLGRRCIHLTWSSRGAISLDGLGLEVVGDPQQADFILAHGTEAVGLPGGGTRDAPLEEMERLLQQCAAAAAARGRPVPMVVANPDLVTVDGGSSLVTMPGTLAAIYGRAGGEVRLMGKPDPVIYEAARQLLPGGGPEDPRQWLAIGDSLEHDVAGAAAAGARSLFVVGGIHAEAARLQGSLEGGCASAAWDDAALRGLCAKAGQAPDYCMAFLQA